MDPLETDEVMQDLFQGSRELVAIKNLGTIDLTGDEPVEIIDLTIDQPTEVIDLTVDAPSELNDIGTLWGTARRQEILRDLSRSFQDPYRHAIRGRWVSTGVRNANADRADVDGFSDAVFVRQNTGFTEEQLNSLQTVKAGLFRIGHWGYGQDEPLVKLGDTCTICFSEFVKHDNCIFLKCNHAYHDCCLRKWFAERACFTYFCFDR